MTQPAGFDPLETQRRARREFIRAHHPDAGGNHDDFVSGLAYYDAAQVRLPKTSTTAVTVVPRHAWPVNLTTIVLRRLRRRHRAPRVR